VSLVDRLPDPIETDRLVLTPLSASDAEDMVDTLSSPDLYVYIGGQPPTLDDLRSRYAVLTTGHSPDNSEEWLNWIVRLGNADRRAIGTVQATVTEDGRRAEVAWVIGADGQGHGYGSEAAVAMVQSLVEAGVGHVTAHVHPEHVASAGVARACHLFPTAEFHEGERLWEWRSDSQKG